MVGQDQDVRVLVRSELTGKIVLICGWSVNQSDGDIGGLVSGVVDNLFCCSFVFC